MNKYKQNEYKYGCEVCKHLASCKPNPFGICKDFKKRVVDESADCGKVDEGE